MTFKPKIITIATGLPIKTSATESVEDALTLRRLEILHIIRDHTQVTFDFIQRRFMAVSGRMLRYDLKKLRDLRLIKKRGTTRGVIYEAR